MNKSNKKMSNTVNYINCAITIGFETQTEFNL